jgi:two-component system OmpR family response regulator
MRLLVVEDDVKIAGAIKKGLELKGYAVDMTHDADSGFAAARGEEYDGVILDRMLPGSMDGVGIASKLRSEGKSTPILMLTARGTIGDKVQGLNSGVDDYLVKPFSFDELTARVGALLRRPAVHTGTVHTVGDLSLDTVSYEVRRGGQPISLSQKEYALLEYLMRHADQVVTKDMIISHVWDSDADILQNTVEVYIGYLRNKIDRPFKNKPDMIQTMRGFGYKLHA